MGERTEYAPGTFCWVDLVTSDSDAAKTFYKGLFGWNATDVPTDAGTVYTMLSQDGRDICALWQMTPEMVQQDIPPHWQSYVSVASADAVTARARELGGQILMEAMDVMDVGRMATLQDPTGAAFAIWEPKRHIGAQLVNAPGAFCWNELQTKDPAAAERFYTSLFGWTANSNAGAMGQTYWAFRNGERSAGGMMEIQAEWGEVLPNWSVYFAVADCDASVAKVKELGGAVVAPPMDIQAVGRFAFVRDPQGAVFAVIKLQAPED